MQKEILFRGKRKHNNKWTEGSILLIAEQSFIIPLSAGRTYSFKCEHTQLCIHNWDEVIPETVGQFTGLTDKNGKRIFEGDKIHCYGGTNHDGTFEFDYDGICTFLNGSFVIKTSDMCIDFGIIEYFEVTGNIFDV